MKPDADEKDLFESVEGGSGSPPRVASANEPVTRGTRRGRSARIVG
jgi:hypothetical protein